MQAAFTVAKRCAEVLGVIAVLYGALAGFVVATGGNLPPWWTPAQAREMQAQIQQFKTEQERENASLQANVDLLLLQSLRDKAIKADARAKASPNDSQATSDSWFAQKALEAFFAAHPGLAKTFATE